MKSRKRTKPAPDLKVENVSLKDRVSELSKEVRKLQRENVHLKVKDQSSIARIKALEKEKLPPKSKPLSKLEAARRIAFVLNGGGYEFVDGKAVQVRPPRGES